MNIGRMVESRDLTPERYERLLSVVDKQEMQGVWRNEVSYLVLGNYDKYPALSTVLDILNRQEDVYAFLMINIGDRSQNSVDKFELLARYVTYIVGVAEDSKGDLRLESGAIYLSEWLLQKSYILKRVYPELDDTEVYSEMHLDGMERLRDRGRFYTWRDIEELKEVTGKLPDQ